MPARFVFNRHAGHGTAQRAKVDKYGNAVGSDFDLVKDRAFAGQTLVVLQLYTGEKYVLYPNLCCCVVRCCPPTCHLA